VLLQIIPVETFKNLEPELEFLPGSSRGSSLRKSCRPARFNKLLKSLRQSLGQASKCCSHHRGTPCNAADKPGALHCITVAMEYQRRFIAAYAFASLSGPCFALNASHARLELGLGRFKIGG